MQTIEAFSQQDKLRLAIENGAGKLPGDLADDLRKLATPEALAIMVGVLVVWAGSHFMGVGMVADVVLLIVGFAMAGASAYEAGKLIVRFADKSLNAKSKSDIDEAGSCLAAAVSLIGVQVLAALLLKTRPKTFKDFTFNRFVSGPRPPGTMFYKPSIKTGHSQFGEMGFTSQWGDIHVTSTLPLVEKRLTLYHELVHSVLSPKLYLFRDFRATLSQNGYAASHLLRFLEELLCETYSLLRVNGFKSRNLIDGIAFPIRGQYTTISAMGSEASGLLLGPINVGGMIYQVYVSGAR